jgi:hypothetical protein
VRTERARQKGRLLSRGENTLPCTQTEIGGISSGSAAGFGIAGVVVVAMFEDDKDEGEDASQS